MSGQPNRYSTSAATYRQQYMDALGARASLDDQVFQAVKVYKQTGQIPAVSSMPDNRSSAEKLADIQGLKVRLIAELRPIIDAHGAQAIVQGVERSPLNGDGSLFTFFAQRIKAIVKQLSEQYGIGIKGDTNDIQTFIKLIEEFYSKNKDTMTTAKSYFDAHQAAGGITAGQIDQLTSEYIALTPKLLAKFGGIRDGRSPASREKVQEFGEYLNLISHIITRAQNATLQEAAILGNTTEVGGVIADNLNLVHDAIIKFKDFQEKLPTLSSVRAVLKQIYTSLPNRNNSLVLKLVENLISLFPPYEELLIVQEALTEIAPGLPPHGPAPSEYPPSSNTISSLSSAPSSVGGPSSFNSGSSYAPSSSSDSSGGYSGHDAAGYIMRQYFPGTASDTTSEYSDLYGPISSDTGSEADEQTAELKSIADQQRQQRFLRDQVAQAIQQASARHALEDQQSVSSVPSSRSSRSSDVHSQANEIQPDEPEDDRYNRTRTLQVNVSSYAWKNDRDAASWADRIQNFIENKENLPRVLAESTDREIIQAFIDCAELPSGNSGVTAAIHRAVDSLHRQNIGTGISKRRRGRPRGCGIKVPFSEKVDNSQGIQASPRYISFGKHVINKKKLGDGILSIRTKSGANIATTPVKHISHNMKIVVDKIVGGAIPSYEELSRLTEEEKAYLHKVSKQADILDKFSIPAPSKDQEEKEIHEYEVMRGEIMSGNDNKELIKKFKLLIIKLSRRGALPKKEVTDILSELVELGY